MDKRRNYRIGCGVWNFPPARAVGEEKQSMWGSLGINVTGIVGAALENVQKMSKELEAQMDAAVAEPDISSPPPPSASIKGSPTPSPSSLSHVSAIPIDIEPNIKMEKEQEITRQTVELGLMKEPQKEKENKEEIVQKENHSPSLPISEYPQEGFPPIDIPTVTEKRIRKPPKKQPIKELIEKPSDSEDGTTKRSQQSQIVSSTKEKKERKPLKSKSTAVISEPLEMITQPEHTIELGPPHSEEINLSTMTKEDQRQASESLSQISQPLIVEPEKEPVQMTPVMIPSLNEIQAQDNHEAIQSIQAKNEELQESLLQSQKKIEMLSDQVQELVNEKIVLEQTVESLKAELSQKDQIFQTATMKLSQQMKQEIDNLGEVIAERERALQSANIQLVEVNKVSEDYSHQITVLSNELNDTKQALKQFQATSVGEAELKREFIKLQEVLREKEESLTAFVTEGQALAKKQSEMEKNVRKSRNEVREKESEIAKLKETKEQSAKTIEELKEVIKQNESNANNLQKQITVLQSVSQSSQDKINKLESDLSAKIDELLVQRKALEGSWNDNNDLKRSLAELKAECDNLRSQIGLGADKASETESSRRDLEQREAILRATNKQPQDSLQRLMSESATREERMREELKETRNRWQEAIASRESLASEVGNATTPLLRQITALQESLRVKSDTWQKVENTLSERTIRAENIAESAENKRLLLETELTELRQKLKESNHQIVFLQGQLSTTEIALEKIRRAEQDYLDRISKFQSMLSEESIQRIALENSIRDLEYRHKRLIEQSREEHDKLISSYEAQLSLLQSEIATLTIQVEGKREETTQKKPKSPQKNSRKDSEDPRMDVKRGKSSYVPVDGESYAVAERSHQTILQQDEKIEHLTRQLQQAQISRDALLEEVSFLSSKLADFEENNRQVGPLTAELGKLRNQNETLLLLLGEKEEELESMLQDLQDVKDMYRQELDRLIEKSIGS